MVTNLIASHENCLCCCSDSFIVLNIEICFVMLAEGEFVLPIMTASYLILSLLFFFFILLCWLYNFEYLSVWKFEWLKIGILRLCFPKQAWSIFCHTWQVPALVSIISRSISRHQLPAVSVSNVKCNFWRCFKMFCCENHPKWWIVQKEIFFMNSIPRIFFTNIQNIQIYAVMLSNLQ